MVQFLLFAVDVRFQDLSSWTRMLTCHCWPRHGCRAHHGCGELFRAVCTGTRPGVAPAIRAGKGWRGRRELAPRCSATQLAARRHDPGQTRRVLNDSYHTHQHTTNTQTTHMTIIHMTITPQHQTQTTPTVIFESVLSKGTSVGTRKMVNCA